MRTNTFGLAKCTVTMNHTREIDWVSSPTIKENSYGMILVVYRQASMTFSINVKVSLAIGINVLIM
jgi:hypothetical protein